MAAETLRKYPSLEIAETDYKLKQEFATGYYRRIAWKKKTTAVPPDLGSPSAMPWSVSRPFF